MKKQFLTVLFLGMALLISACGSSANATVAAPVSQAQPASSTTATPIKHIVVIFQENVSFDQWN